MFALGLVNPRHLTLKRTAARGCSVPLPDVVNVGRTDHARTTQAGPAPTFTATRERGMDE
jgi:hypothetical protein